MARESLKPDFREVGVDTEFAMLYEAQRSVAGVRDRLGRYCPTYVNEHDTRLYRRRPFLQDAILDCHNDGNPIEERIGYSTVGSMPSAA
jgi:hypothetical protein